MNQILIALAAIAHVVSAIATDGNTVTSVCSVASYDDGTPHAALTSPYTVATSYGSAVSSSMSQALASSTAFDGQAYAAYAIVLRNFQLPLFSLSSLDNADVADAINIYAQLAQNLDILAKSGISYSNGAVLGTGLVNIRSVIILANDAISSLISASGGVSCDKQNSINSLGSQISNLYSELALMPTVSDFLAISMSWNIVDSVTCPLDCSTFTVTASTTDEITSSATSTSTDDTTTSSSTSSSEIISSRTVSGTVQRCLVRPTTS